MKMGDRAAVQHKFTTEERQAAEGKATVVAAAAGDEYGADILLGAGGMVCPARRAVLSKYRVGVTLLFT